MLSSSSCPPQQHISQVAAMPSSSSCPTQQQYLSSGSNAQIFIMTSTTISLKWQQCSVLPSCLLQQYLPSSSNAQFFNMSSPRQVLTELERIPDSESSHQHTRKRKKKPRPSPIALEPCAGWDWDKKIILEPNIRTNCSVCREQSSSSHFAGENAHGRQQLCASRSTRWLQSDLSSFYPYHQHLARFVSFNHHDHLHLSGIALASSLVTLGNPRKASVDPTQKVVLSTFIVLCSALCHCSPYSLPALIWMYNYPLFFRWSRQIQIQNFGKVERWLFSLRQLFNLEWISWNDLFFTGGGKWCDPAHRLVVVHITHEIIKTNWRRTRD